MAPAPKIADLRRRAGKSNRSLLDYWDFGHDLTPWNSRAPRTTPQLAKEMGVPNGTNLRQAMKFADRIKRGVAARLEKAGVPWRGVVYMLGVEDDQRLTELIEYVLRASLTNSNELRAYIEKNCSKARRPRIPADIEAAFAKADTKAKELNELLMGVGDLLENAEAVKLPRKRASSLRKSLTMLSTTMSATIKRLEST